MQTKLYVGNLPWSTTEEELRELFEAYGDVKSAKIILDRETQRSRGFAFVEFVDEASALDAIEQENDHEFNGRRLKVSAATERSRDDRGPREPRNDSRPREAAPRDNGQRSYNGNNGGQRPNNGGQRRSRPNKRRDDYAE